MNPFQFCLLLVAATLVPLVRSAVTRDRDAPPPPRGTATPSSAERPGRRTDASGWHELATAILLHDRSIQAHIEYATRATGTHRASDDALRDRDGLRAIGRYSSWVARHVRRAARSLDQDAARLPTSIRLSELHSHLRTLRVLGDVLRLTARRPIAD